MKTNGFTSLSDIFENNFTKDNLLSRPNRLDTGFNRLNILLGGGIAPGLIILGAIPGLGKSTLAIQIACNIASLGTPVLYYSLEMSTEGISAKCITRHIFQGEKKRNSYSDDELRKAAQKKEIPKGLITADQILSLKAHEEKWSILENGMKEYAGGEHLHIRDENVGSTKDICDSVIDFMADNPDNPPLVIVDYLQIVPANKESVSSSDGRAKIDANLNLFAKLAHGQYRSGASDENGKTAIDNGSAKHSVGVPVLLISSLSRENYKKTIEMQSFKDSGGIEYSADVLLGLQFAACHSEKGNLDVNKEKNKVPREVEVVVIKQRFGASGEAVPFKHYAAYDYFEEVGGSDESSHITVVESPSDAEKIAAPQKKDVPQEKGSADRKTEPEENAKPSDSDKKKAAAPTDSEQEEKAEKKPRTKNMANTYINNCKVYLELCKGRMSNNRLKVSVTNPDKSKASDEKYDETCVSYSVSKELSCYDLCIADAIYTIFEDMYKTEHDIELKKQNRQIFSALDVLKVLTGDDRATLTNEKRQNITKSIEKLSSTKLELDCRKQLIQWRKNKAKERDIKEGDEDLSYSGVFLSVIKAEKSDTYSFVTEGNLHPMPLYNYAHKIGQVVHFPRMLLDVTKRGSERKLSNTDEIIMLKRKIMQRLEQMRNYNNNYISQSIRCTPDDKNESLLSQIGITCETSGCSTEKTWRQKCRKTIDDVKVVMEYLMHVGYLKSCEFTEIIEADDVYGYSVKEIKLAGVNLFKVL